VADQVDDQGVSSHDEQHSSDGPTRRAFVVGGANVMPSQAKKPKRPPVPS
jgi:hypothetical protein